jgi:predicted Zn-dependent protease with MMP-like domain
MAEFVTAVDSVVAGLPSQFRECLDNVAIDVEQRPDRETLHSMGLGDDEWDEIMGLFDGTSLTEQQFDEWHPNRVTLFKESIECACRSRAEVEYEIRRTLIHELAHHFGYDEEDLDEFEGKPSPFDNDE